MTAIAFAEREDDLARMTIHRLDDARLVCRRRTPQDRIDPSHRMGEYEDLWVHVRSQGRYIRHDVVYDEERGVHCYDYSSYENGRLWLRSVDAWYEIVDGRQRFERITQA